MKKLANILDENNTTKYDKIFNKCTSLEEIDVTLPTLVIGIETAKKYVDGFSMFNRNGKNGGFSWTFARNERRKEHNEDLFNFKKSVILDKVSEIKYEYIEFPCYPIGKTMRFIEYMNGSDKKLCFLMRDSNFVFIYSRKYKHVFGLSLSLCEYCGIDKSKVVGKIKSNPNNKIINGLNYIDEETRRIIGDNIHYMLPLYDYFA